MRTTLTIDSDVAANTKKMMAKTGLTLKEIINRALRAGLKDLDSPPSAKRYRTEPRAMGLKPGLNYDDVSDLLAISEGEDHR